eukprot:TRINITY_DN3369_c0_g1_i2.p2 TRINITY_DN3369_c0_g1~~TRINITY_DN3369_c0_g1_i2.p2  ORF type:complete len:146 (+),score=17.99 TRINITY_DN3369_c0_g1_i2:436-873(+)
MEMGSMIWWHSAQTISASFGPVTWEKLKEELLGQLRDLVKENCRYIIPDPSPEYMPCRDVVMAGYLAKQGLIRRQWTRYYVKYTGDKLFYYYREKDVNARGVIPVARLRFKTLSRKLVLAWQDIRVPSSCSIAFLFSLQLCYLCQ